jgi:hypothetical protein
MTYNLERSESIPNNKKIKFQTLFFRPSILFYLFFSNYRTMESFFRPDLYIARDSRPN